MTRAGAIVGLATTSGLAVAAVAALARPALADPTRLVTEPAGWRRDPEQATALAQRFAATGHFGALPSVTAAEAYVADRPGVALYVTRATAALPAEPVEAARVTRAALDELRASSARARLTGGAAQERGWQARVEAEARQVTATLTWIDTASHAVETARVVVASDGERVVAVTGECVAGDAADPAVVAACQAALATLDPGVAASRRVALTLAAEAADPAPEARGAAGPPASSSSSREPARLGDGSKIAMPPMTIPLDRPAPDRRPVLVGAGVIVLALALWWNRRQRDLFGEEERGERAPRGRRRHTDDDADDLHAAARGEGPAGSDTPAAPAAPDRQDP